MRISLAQITASRDPQENIDLVRSSVHDAVDAGARLCVLPEATMRRFGGSIVDVAEPLDGPWATAVRGIADDAGITVVAGMFTPAVGGDERVRNTLLITGGGVDTSYDKIHLFDAFGFAESDTVAPGSDPVVTDIDGVGVGFATCYDIRFPGLFQTLADRGALLTVVPASWGRGPGKVDQWTLLARARALDSTTFIAACGQADPAESGIEITGSAPVGVGNSMVVSPTGHVLDQLNSAPGMLTIDVDTDEIGAVRQNLPVLENRKF
ncbi:hydrolase [Rhodococcus sp. Leaf7]|uniref:carbon-nitrogen hydrolase family protein n=1 Tax=unclassified Rhodococcus (in: high G+C Gram-positive bacteria) TaxID=192944 RepID=UPI0006FCA33D|nr:MULTISPECIES: carbon-nitrogen hydrolase family protein [unclassified Rhodococcus (in: high G+C Gram-positive bacteria)]KQU06820.1 hydrolase [Rhodococcus sp. Leaf7]KQU42339.1 hydrolase [Rhodococcus sp. Leaf247]